MSLSMPQRFKYHQEKWVASEDEIVPARVWSENRSCITHEIEEVHSPYWTFSIRTVQEWDRYFEALNLGIYYYVPLLEPTHAWDTDRKLEHRSQLFGFLTAAVPKLMDPEYSRMVRDIARAYMDETDEEMKKKIRLAYRWITELSYLDEHGDGSYITALGDVLLVYPEGQINFVEFNWQNLTKPMNIETNIQYHRIILPPLAEVSEFFRNLEINILTSN